MHKFLRLLRVRKSCDSTPYCLNSGYNYLWGNHINISPDPSSPNFREHYIDDFLLYSSGWLFEWLKEIMTNLIEFWPWEVSHGDRKISSNLVSRGPARNSWLKFQHFINHSRVLHPLEAHSFPSQPGTGIWQVQLSTRDYC